MTNQKHNADDKKMATKGVSRSFNNYQDMHAIVPEPVTENDELAEQTVTQGLSNIVITDQLDEPNEATDFSEVSVELEIIDPEVLCRRDKIVYILYLKRGLNAADLLHYLTSSLPFPIEIIISDIKSLKSPDTFKTHKRRVKESLINTRKRKIALKIQGVRAINAAMEQSVKFDSDMLVNLSIRYDYTPKQVVDEILKYKKLSTQVAINKDKNHSAPLIRALMKYAKLNIKY
ncbi:hypothetical protein [Shewanella phaeophyticola]|uniref:Uncharacterized protein n=1 Tax=Shewanella phaeophyticola TaxID=2978345 RepID=A0ABT2P348_9GAMM|nr:hypothetical protein [Shewanella sp. KJ10-1]MCT8985795.1 hypothetical protein [Shewanella sp. KJ10-1]